MKSNTYSSLTAFLAHWRALKDTKAEAPAADDLVRRATMDELIATLPPGERAALEASSDDDGWADDGATRRHRERAELRLARELRTRGVLTA